MRKKYVALASLILLFLVSGVFLIAQASYGIDAIEQNWAECVHEVGRGYKCPPDGRFYPYTPTPNNPPPDDTLPPSTVLPTVAPCISTADAAYYCNYETYVEPIVVYNCTAGNVVIRPNVSSVGIADSTVNQGWIDSGGSVVVVADVEIPGYQYETIYQTEDGGYIAADVVQTTVCPQLTVEPPVVLNCNFDTQHQAAIEASISNVSGEVFEGLTDEEACDLAQQIHLRESRALLSAAAHRHVTHEECFADTNYSASLIAFIDLLDTLRQANSDAHEALLALMETEGFDSCTFIPALMQDHLFENITQTDDVLFEAAVQSLILSCQPFTDEELVVRISDTLFSHGGDDLLDDLNSPDRFCNIVNSLSRLGGIVYEDSSDGNGKLWLIFLNDCGFDTHDALQAMVYARTIQVDVIELDANISLELCNAFLGNTNTTILNDYLVNFEDLPIEEQIELEVIETILEDAMCAADENELFILTYSLWDRLNEPLENNTDVLNALATSNPCEAILEYLAHGNPPPTRDISRVNSVITSVRNEYTTPPTPEEPTTAATPNRPIFPFEMVDTIFGTGDRHPDSVAVVLTQLGNTTRLYTVAEGKWALITAVSQQHIRSVAIGTDGQTIVYLVEDEGNWSLWQYVIGTTEPNAIHNFSNTDEYRPYVDPATGRGDRIVFSTTDPNTVIFTMQDSVGRRDLFSMELDGSTYQRLTCAIENLPGGGYHPDYSPSGSYILFGTDVEPGFEVLRLEYSPTINCEGKIGELTTTITSAEMECFGAVYNSDATSQLLLCENNDTVSIYRAEKQQVQRSRNWQNGEDINPTRLVAISPGPSYDFFTVFDENNHAYFVTWGLTQIGTETSDTDSGAIPVNPGGDEIQLEVLYVQWAQEDISSD